jgi:ribonuclease HI
MGLKARRDLRVDKGHADDPNNHRVDRLVRAAALSADAQLDASAS